MYVIFIPLLREVFRLTCQDIRLPTLLPRSKGHNKVKTSQKLRPPSLLTSEYLFHHKVFQITIISKDRNSKLSRLQIWVPFLESHDNREKLLIMNRVVAL